eukprot:scaffold25153_cov88-Isochrysis_galbana.AAC.1
MPAIGRGSRPRPHPTAGAAAALAASSRRADQHADAEGNGVERRDASGAQGHAEGGGQVGAPPAQLHRRRELERSRRGGEEVVDAHDGVEVEAEQQRDDDQLGCHGG